MPITVYAEANKDHIRFGLPRSATVWRYLDIGKYLDLITKRKLWFTRVSELRRTDPYEGGLTSDDERKTEAVLEATTREGLKDSFVQNRMSGYADMMDRVPEKSFYWFQLLYLSTLSMVDMNARTHSISCWHENQTESDAMWALYAQRHAGVAIKSTVDRILRAFHTTKRTVYVAKVTYDSANNLSVLSSGVCDSLLVKRHAFHHENEVRIIASTYDGYEAPEWTQENQVCLFDPSKSVPPGVYIECDLNELLEEVVISPLMESYSYEAIEAISRNMIPTISIRQSTLLTRGETPWKVSKELSVMWAEYNRTHLLRDIGDISSSLSTGK